VLVAAEINDPIRRIFMIKKEADEEDILMNI